MRLQAQTGRRLLRLALALAAALLAALAAAGRASAQDWAGAAYIVTGLGDSALVLTEDADMPGFESDLLRAEARYGGGFELYLEPDQYVTIHHCGRIIQSRTDKAESVSEFLARHGVSPSPLEGVSIDLTGQRLDLTVASDLLYRERVQETAPHGTVRRANPQMLQGTERVVREGADGVQGTVYEILWSNGQITSRQPVQVLSTTAVDRIVEYGTAAPKAQEAPASGPAKVEANSDGSGTLTLPTGEVLRYTGVRTMSATAYTAGHGGVGTRTASGTAVHRGTVAVDRRVIPLGTRMYIVTKKGYVYGTAVAEDTGVKGNKIDLYFDTYQQCISFGRQDCLVYFLE